MERRNFLKGLGAGLAGVSAAGIVGPLAKSAGAADKQEIGECKSVTVHCISETSWFDSPQMLKDIKDAGGAMVSMYDIPWTQSNIGGYVALIELEQLDGSKKLIQLDSGWNQDWTDYVMEKSGLGKQLEEKKIDLLVISHEHEDHYWGLKSTLKRYPGIPMVVPNTFYPEGKALLQGKYKNDYSHVENDVPHTGELIELGPDDLYNPYPGMAIKMFDIPIMLKCRGEQNLFFKVKDKGVVAVTGCCHQGVLTMMHWARRNIAGFKPYGLYGGLHIAAFENWDPKFDDIIRGVKQMGLEKIGCNHCTGWIWASKARAQGLPIVLGTEKYRDYEKLPTTGQGAPENVYLRNGDVIMFG
ncbi:MAG: 7,8-dihydropterin-6-yl-methyl-4-(beta-D-ribofuranosyl)aminobenzene 5-phosphate synthase [Desulfovibrionales bacterium]|jgi:7,8-dihydropterin-6-yl-methyl-4-(beta-D-ribofuranosyl)aminobenzene 5'-phosphate synthase|nr:7,8-dihydropterin-6-yl-methyl-4-(beta-D-ribofuranosyl)aminobenzene 5-phosphate synthase [Desulfovibrionales bacterium]